jgi:hypothetical protein
MLKSTDTSAAQEVLLDILETSSMLQLLQGKALTPPPTPPQPPRIVFPIDTKDIVAYKCRG